MLVPETAAARSPGGRGRTPIGRAATDADLGANPCPRSTRFLFILTIFTLGNSTDAFLLLRLSDAGLAPAYLPLAWAALHVVKASLSTLGGALVGSARPPAPIVAGWLLYAVVYAGFALSESPGAAAGVVSVYGVHFALVEGSEKALSPTSRRRRPQGTAFGWYNAVLGFGALAASLLFGALWQAFGPRAAFLTGAGLAVAAAILLIADGAVEGRRLPRVLTA